MKCGCCVTFGIGLDNEVDTSDYEIVFCPLHAVAEEMLYRLKSLFRATTPGFSDLLEHEQRETKLLIEKLKPL
jgi:uncharacterized protein YfcZ (UPF0381/DUF406 family)